MKDDCWVCGKKGASFLTEVNLYLHPKCEEEAQRLMALDIRRRHTARSNPPVRPTVQEAAATLCVASPISWSRALHVSEHLRQLGVPHILIGGLAVGLLGHPRLTKDADFLVGEEAFENVRWSVLRPELKVYQTGAPGSDVDILAPFKKFPWLSGYLKIPAQTGSVPILPVEALVVLKLDAGRIQDIADVSALLRLRNKQERAAIEVFLFRHTAGLQTSNKKSFVELWFSALTEAIVRRQELGFDD